jgi:surface antigen
MKKTSLLAAAALLAFAAAPAMAQPNGQNYGQPYSQGYGQNRNFDPDGYYSQSDPNGYYDLNGNYLDMRGRRIQRDNRGAYIYGNQSNNQRTSANYYQQGAYEQNCSRGNVAAGTIFGAIAGGLIGSAASKGNGGAVVGGAVLGGLLGNTISRDIDCNDQPYAFQTYSTGLNGDLNRRYEWNHGQSRGYFMPTREFRRGNTVCRDFTETTYRNGRELTRTGTSCRAQDGNWRFD